MKRSDMIEKLTDLLVENEDSKATNKMAKEILDFLENEGMMPPLSGTDYWSVRDDEIGVPACEWGKE